MSLTISNEINEAFIRDYLARNIGAFLIYNPALGLDNAPTEEEFQRRKELTMKEAVKYEVGGYSLNGYRRYIINSPDLDINISAYIVSIKLRIEFQAIGGDIGPFTHVCIARGLNTHIPASMGQGRGDTQGNLIGVKPVGSNKTLDLETGTYHTNNGIILSSPQKYRTEEMINITAKSLG